MSICDRVIVCVFDGLRPDMIQAATTPNLVRLARRGTWFREARSVFPSMTRVATASIATGAMPRTHGIVGNAFYFPKAIPEHVLDVSNIADVKRAEAATGGHFLTAPTFADELARAGKRLAVVHTGSIGSTYLINPRAQANRHWTFTVFGEEATETPAAIAEVTARFGPLPPRTLPRFAEVDYATDVMVEHVLPDAGNEVALIWYNEPDTSYHYKMLGSVDTTDVLKHVDAALGRILAWVDRQPNAERIAVLAASDHGQISTEEEIPLAELLTAAGHATVRSGKRHLDGAVVTYTGGNMGEIRVLEGGAQRRDAIARWLTEQPFIGALFSPGRNDVDGAAPGSLSHALVGLDHERQPDLVYVLRSSDAADPFGYPGLCRISGGGIPVGGGMHGGLNRHELNTTLMLAAPGVAAGHVDQRAAGIIDIAPTILGLLGVPVAPTMCGAPLQAPAQETTLHTLTSRHADFQHSVTVARGSGGRLIIDRGLHGD
ncbi:MAG: alkaline phosphatase family protein [Hyphomicrobiaceae bacterium]